MLKQLFSRPKYDGVVDAVHYDDAGNIDWVRAYERRGPTWSDHVLLGRAELIERLKAGKRFYSGKRILFQAGEFEVGLPLKIIPTEGGEILVTGDLKTSQDQLAGVPTL